VTDGILRGRGNGRDQFGRLRKRDDAIELYRRYQMAASIASVRISPISNPQNRKCRLSKGGAAISDLC
jgi:hypothetical protein